LAGTSGRGAWTISNVSLSVLGPPPVLKVTGTGDADTITLIRNAADPSQLDVQVTNAAGTESKTVPFANITQIQVNGLGGNDTLIVDSSNGILKVPGGILYAAADDTGGPGDTLRVQGKGSTEFQRESTATRNGLVQVISPAGRQVVSFTGVETLDNKISGPTNVPAILGFIAGGLTYVAAATRVIPKEFALLGVALPFIGLGVGEILNRAHATEVTPFGTPPEGPVASNLGEKLPGDTPFLQRIFEEGPNGFRIADIGQGATDTGTSAPSLAA